MGYCLLADLAPYRKRLDQAPVFMKPFSLVNTSPTAFYWSSVAALGALSAEGEIIGRERRGVNLPLDQDQVPGKARVELSRPGRDTRGGKWRLTSSRSRRRWCQRHLRRRGASPRGRAKKESRRHRSG